MEYEPLDRDQIELLLSTLKETPDEAGSYAAWCVRAIEELIRWRNYADAIVIIGVGFSGGEGRKEE